MYKLKEHTSDLHTGGGQFFSSEKEYTDLEMSKVSEYIKEKYFIYVEETPKRKNKLKPSEEAAT